MTALEAIDLFKTEMINEIFHSMADDAVKENLVEATKSVAETVSSTFEAERRK